MLGLKISVRQTHGRSSGSIYGDDPVRDMALSVTRTHKTRVVEHLCLRLHTTLAQEGVLKT